MTVKRRKGDAAKADLLFSRIVRSRQHCEKCGEVAPPEDLDTAHIASRRYSATRCMEENAWALHPKCHRLVDDWAHEFMWLVESTIGVDRYIELCLLAKGGISQPSKKYWRAERERLEARCEELGIPTTWRVT